jgi:hypothetical protein
MNAMRQALPSVVEDIKAIDLVRVLMISIVSTSYINKIVHSAEAKSLSRTQQVFSPLDDKGLVAFQSRLIDRNLKVELRHFYVKFASKDMYISLVDLHYLGPKRPDN